MQLHFSITLLAVLLVAASVSTSEAAAKCSTKTIFWAKSGHNELCQDTCKRYGKRKAIKSGDSLLCADYDGENFDSPLPTDWVAGSFRDIAKDPFNAQKQCWIHRKYFEPGEETDNPIASSSNFYCGCWKETPACSKYKPKWFPHGAASGKPMNQATCKDVCISKGMAVADRTPESYEYICRLTSDTTKSTLGYEHFDGNSGLMMCHFVQYDKVNDESYNAMNEVYECLCQKKAKK